MRVSRTSLLVGLLAAQLLAGPIVSTLGAAVKSDQLEVCPRLGIGLCWCCVLPDARAAADNSPLHLSVLLASSGSQLIQDHVWSWTVVLN